MVHFTVIVVFTKQGKFSKFKFYGLLLSTFGLVLVLGVAMKDTNSLGIALALGSAFVYAAYIIIGGILAVLSPLSKISFCK